MHAHIIGMAGKITDEMIFDAERRSKLSETIVGAMTEEERSNPDLIVATVCTMDYACVFSYMGCSCGSSAHYDMLYT